MGLSSLFTTDVKVVNLPSGSELLNWLALIVGNKGDASSSRRDVIREGVLKCRMRMSREAVKNQKSAPELSDARRHEFLPMIDDLAHLATVLPMFRE